MVGKGGKGWERVEVERVFPSRILILGVLIVSRALMKPYRLCYSFAIALFFATLSLSLSLSLFLYPFVRCLWNFKFRKDRRSRDPVSAANLKSFTIAFAFTTPLLFLFRRLLSLEKVRSSHIRSKVEIVLVSNAHTSLSLLSSTRRIRRCAKVCAKVREGARRCMRSVPITRPMHTRLRPKFLT